MQKKSFSPNKVNFSNLRVIDEKGLKESFKCTICLGYAIDPLFCKKCENAVYCRNCLVEYSKKFFNNQQPSCALKCGSKEFNGPTKKVAEILNYIKIGCVYEGCNKYIGNLDFKKHLEKCEYRKYHCNNNPCKKEGLLNEMEAHSKKCIYREIKCKYCKNAIIKSNKENHLKEECPEYFVKCKYCEIDMKRKDYQRHITDDGACLKKIRVSLENRIKELEKLDSERMNQVAILQSSIKDYENKLKEKNSEINELKKSKKKLEKKVKDKNNAISELKTTLTYTYKKFNKKDDSDDSDDEQPLNINNEIKRKENRIQNIQIKNESNFLQQKDIRRFNTSSNTPKKDDKKNVILGRNTINNPLSNNNLTGTKTTRSLRRINSEMNLSLNNSDI